MSDGGGIWVVAGAPAYGKTTLIARAIAEDFHAGSRILIFDPTGDMARSMEGFGVPVEEMVVLPDIRSKEIPRVQAEQAFASGKRFVILYVKRPIEFESLKETWLDVAVEMERGNVYATDEAEILLPNVPTGKDPRKLPLFTIARNRGCRLYLATKIPQRLHIDCRANARGVCVFHAGNTGFVTDGCLGFGDPEEYKPALELPVGKYLYRAPFRDHKIKELPIYDSVRDPLPFEPLLT